MTPFSRLLLLILWLAAFTANASVRAQEMPEKDAQPAAPAAPEPVPEPPLPMKKVPLDIPMEAFGIANPDCVEWTDTCRTCARDAENRISCSTPGIACLPQDIACKQGRK